MNQRNKSPQYKLPIYDDGHLHHQAELIKCLKKKVQQLNQTIIIMEEQLTIYEIAIKKIGKELSLQSHHPNSLVHQIQNAVEKICKNEGKIVVVKEVQVQKIVQKVVEVQKIVEVEKVVQRPLFVEKTVEKPVYIDRNVEVPVYYEKIIEKECTCKGLREEIVST